MKSILFFSLSLSLFLFMDSCTLIKKDSCSLDIPPVLCKHEKALKEFENFTKNFRCGDVEIPAAYTDKTSGQIKSDITFYLIQNLFSSLGQTPKNLGRNWQVKPWSIDLDGDNHNEYILFFWDASEFYSTLCIIKKISGEWRAIYANEIQGWAYRPADIFVVNSFTKEKTIVCSYESVTHSTEDYGTRYRILKIVDGRVQELLDIPEHYHNYFTNLDIILSPRYDSLELKVSYFFSDKEQWPQEGATLIESEDTVSMVWDENKKSFNEHYRKLTKGESPNNKLNEKKLHFLLALKTVDDPDFANIWREELLQRRTNATPRERKAIDAILKKKTIAVPAP